MHFCIRSTFILLTLFLFSGSALASTTSASADSVKKKKRTKLPLEPGRELQFTTDEVSWMSLDVSPDGQTIAFDLLGDIYTLPISGGKATQITRGMSYDSQPRFSPDGKRLAFISDSSGTNNIWFVNPDGKELKQLTKDKSDGYLSPEWTPDGMYIVVSKPGANSRNHKLFLIHKDGGSGAQLLKKPANMKTLGAAFGKDGRYIWYARRTGAWQYNAVFPQFQLERYDRETGKSTRMTSRFGSAIRPALSADGKWLVYGTRYEHQTGLRIRNLETTDERWLAYPVQRDEQESLASLDVLPGYAFTPDSRSVIASYGGKIWRIPVDGGQQVNIPFSVDVSIQLGPEVSFEYPIKTEASFTARQIRHAVPSPDGKRIVFTALDRLYIASLPSGTPERLTKMNTGEHFPTWSPDGKWIAFTTWQDQEGGHIYKMKASGKGKPIKLTTNPAMYIQTAWSPVDDRIVAIRASARDLKESTGFFGGGLARQFIWVPAKGGALTVIAPTDGRSVPHFSGSGDRIYASSFAKGLVSFRWDGTDEKAHVKVTGRKAPGRKRPAQAGLIMKAPKGDQALAQVGSDIFTVTIPYVGGETPTVSVANPKNANFPAKKLTDIGGQFPVWSADTRKIHWSIGNAFVTWDLDSEQVFTDSLKAAAKADSLKKANASSDSSTADSSASSGSKKDHKKKGKKKKKPAYKPDEMRIEISAQRDIPQGFAVLRGGRAITMRGHEIIENADIVIRNNRIEAIGKQGQVSIPEGAHIIDVSGKTIIPGFVDTHYHAQWLIPEMHSTQVWQYLTNLAYGVTTTRDPQTATTDILSYQDRVETGAMIGPRIYSTGPGVFSGEGIKDLDHAMSVLKRYSTYYDTKTLKMYMSGNRQQRQWIIMAAKELKLMPTTEGGLNFRLNMTHAIDGYSGLEHSLPIYPLYKDVIQLFVKSQITYSPTLLVSYGGPWAENYYYTRENVYDNKKLRHFTPYKELASKTLRRSAGPGPAGWTHRKEQIFDKHAEFVADLIAAGGRAGVGSHGQLQGLGYHWELWSMQAGGLSTHDALRVATLYGAEGIGFGKDLGSLEAGKLADLIVLDKNPIDNIRNTDHIKYVMKNGRLYDASSLDEQYPRQQKLPQFYWQNDAPAVNAGIR